jgi:hypothetical protein
MVKLKRKSSKILTNLVIFKAKIKDLKISCQYRKLRPV